MSARKPYPTGVGDDEWAFVAPSLTLMDPEAPQRQHDLREAFDALRRVVRAGAPWRLPPTTFPPWPAAYRQHRRGLAAGCFEAMVHDLRCLLRPAAGRAAPSAAVFDSRALQSSPESDARAGYDGHKRRRGSKLHLAVDTLGHLLALRVTPADAQDRAQVGALAAAVQEATGEHVEVAFVDQGYTGDDPAAEAAALGAPEGAAAWRWSSCPRPSAASSSCRAAGWWSAASRGRRAPAASPATTSACPSSSPACTSSPSPA